MKTMYIKCLTLCGCFAGAAILFGCSSSLTYNDALQRNISRIDDSEKHDDARFLVEAASYNLLATKIAETAIDEGYSASVVSMAQENLEEHREFGRELEKLARQEDVILPAQMSDEHQRLLAELESADRREFDRTYLRILREISQKDSRQFARMATDAESADVRAFAARNLGAFESYQSEIETVDAELLRTY